MNQLELHKKIEDFFKAGTQSANIDIAKGLLINDDAKRFFFSQADESWLAWLWEEGFLNGLKAKTEDPTKYSYRMPEPEYLIRMADKNPALVAEILLDENTATKETNFNPEVVDRFLWIIGILPAEQIKILTTKIRDEKWLYLMRSFRQSGYALERIIKKLVEKKEGEAVLEFAQAVFTVKSKAEISENGNSFSLDDPFYISDIGASGIFEALADIESVYTEKALQVTTNVMKQIIKLAKPDEDKIFDYEDLYSLFDVDFFTLEIEDKRSTSYRIDMKNLAATIKKLIERTIGKQCGDVNRTKKLFEYINQLPSCRSVWRLRLFALAQCPETFKEELGISFFKVFSVGERYFEIEGGAEYHQALIRCFGVLNKETTQREYVQKVFGYFGAKLDDEDKEKWRKRDGVKILSLIKDQLTVDEKKQAKETFGVYPDEINYTPEPSVGKSRGGSVNHLSPVNLADFTIDQIVTNLKTKWTPEKLNEEYKDDDFLSPRGVEGLGDALKEDVKKRTDEYLKNINAFFDKSAIHPHYLYSLLRGIEEMLRNKEVLNPEQVDKIFGLFQVIQNEGEKIPFKKKDDKSWLADWVTVHKVIVDALLYLLENKETKEATHKAHKEEIKNLISYLFTVKDSPSKEDEKPEQSEPYHIAINSVRGRAFECFVVFTENDGKILSEDTKKLYKEALSDNSLAVRFVIGRYLASFYFRDKEFIIKQLPEIFPTDNSERKDAYLATWEGYLSNTLYDKLFVALKDYYKYAITLDPKDYTERKYSKGLDESLAIHIALAFIHLGLEIKDDLFIQFWNKPNITRHQEFISFIGRSCITRDQAGEEWLKENIVSKEKLIKFWNWALKSDIIEPKALSGFGFWINPNKEVLDDAVLVEKIAETLKKSDGSIDWDYGLLRRMSIFAEKNGEKTLEIISNYLFDSNNNLNQNRHVPMFSLDNEIKGALEIIYRNGDAAVKQKVANLISLLIEKGSSIFWGLKEVIRDNA